MRIVVGGGIAGLTATAYLSKAGYKTMFVREGTHNCGGLVNTFERDGFVFDGGVRAIVKLGSCISNVANLGWILSLFRITYPSASRTR